MNRDKSFDCDWVAKGYFAARTKLDEGRLVSLAELHHSAMTHYKEYIG